jgi:hypothetical protein
MDAAVGLEFMAFNATFNNISVISWQSVLLVEEMAVGKTASSLAKGYDSGPPSLHPWWI